MNGTRKKVRGLLLAGLMVLSVFAGTMAFSGAAAADTNISGDSGTVWQGQTLVFNSSNDSHNGPFELRTNDSSKTLQDQYNENSNDNVVIETSTLEQGRYYLEDSNDTVVAYFELVEQSLSADFADSSVAQDGSTTLNLDSNRASGYVVNVTSSDLTDSQLQAIFSDADTGMDGVQIDSESENAQFPASDIPVGEYALTFEVVDSAAQASATIKVGSEDPADANFANSVVQEDRGDEAMFTVNMENMQGSQVKVNVGSSDLGYLSTVTVEDTNDDGKVTVSMDTYNAGQVGSNEDSIYTSEDGEVVDATRQTGSLSSPLDAGDYDLNATNAAGDEEYDVATLVLNERSTDGAASHTAPGASSISGMNASELAEILSQGSSVAESDKMIVEIQASGLYAYLDDANTNLSQEGPNGLQMDIVQTNPGPNQDGKELNASKGTIVSDAENDRFFLVLDTDSSMEGDEYEATFTLSNALVEENESVSTTFEIVERTGSLDDVSVVSDDDQKISGSTSVAPGSKVNLRLRSTGDSPFLKTADNLVVQDDGTFSGTFDLSDVAPGTNFTAKLTGAVPETTKDSQVGEAGSDGKTHEGEVRFDDQQSDGDSVTVQSVSMSKGGFVVIHGPNGDVIGVSDYMDKGDHSDVQVDLDSSISEDTELEAMAHLDSNGDLAFDAGDDAPYKEGGSPVSDKATVDYTGDNDQQTTDDNGDSDDQTTSANDGGQGKAKETANTTSEEGPGFGIAIALIALVAAALLAVRRD